MFERFPMPHVFYVKSELLSRSLVNDVAGADSLVAGLTLCGLNLSSPKKNCRPNLSCLVADLGSQLFGMG